MSKKKPVQILGPDGKPYVKPTAAKLPTNTDITYTVTFDAGSVVPDSSVDYVMPYQRSWLSSLFGNIYNGHPKTPAAKADLRAAVADQVDAITADFDGQGGEELPEAPRDLTTYRDAWASAAKKCSHEDAVEVMFGREWVCDTCHRMLNREDMRKSGWNRFRL